MPFLTLLYVTKFRDYICMNIHHEKLAKCWKCSSRRNNINEEMLIGDIFSGPWKGTESFTGPSGFDKGLKAKDRLLSILGKLQQSATKSRLVPSF